MQRVYLSAHMFVVWMLSGKSTRQPSKYSHAEGSESEYCQICVCFDNDMFTWDSLKSFCCIHLVSAKRLHTIKYTQQQLLLFFLLMLFLLLLLLLLLFTELSSTQLLIMKQLEESVKLKLHLFLIIVHHKSVVWQSKVELLHDNRKLLWTYYSYFHDLVIIVIYCCCCCCYVIGKKFFSDIVSGPNRACLVGVLMYRVTSVIPYKESRGHSMTV